MTEPIQIHVSSPEETRRIATVLAPTLAGGSVIALEGDLGAGKTFFCQALAKALKVREPVTSPSFAIVQEYSGRLPVFHFDFYRLGSQAEVIDLGLEDYLDSDGVCLIEWPQIAKALLPEETISIDIKYGEADEGALLSDARGLTIFNLSDKQRKLLQP